MQKKLIAIAIFCSLAGLFLLAILKPNVSPQLLELSGEVIKVNEHENVAFIDIIPDNLTVVSFNGHIQTGKQVLHGRLQQYNGRVEFVIDD